MIKASVSLDLIMPIEGPLQIMKMIFRYAVMEASGISLPALLQIPIGTKTSISWHNIILLLVALGTGAGLPTQVLQSAQKHAGQLSAYL